MKLWTATGVAFLVAGVLEVLFFGLSILGVVVGGVMTFATITGELRDLEALLGPVILVFYGIWLVVTALAGPLHVVAGGMILAGRRNRKVVWAATVCSILPALTVYCAPTSLIAGVLGLVTLLKDEER